MRFSELNLSGYPAGILVFSGKLGRGQIPDGTVGSGQIVVHPPALRLLNCNLQASEPRLIEALGPDAAVEGFDKRALSC